MLAFDQTAKTPASSGYQADQWVILLGVPGFRWHPPTQSARTCVRASDERQAACSTVKGLPLQQHGRHLCFRRSSSLQHVDVDWQRLVGSVQGKTSISDQPLSKLGGGGSSSSSNRFGSPSIRFFFQVSLTGARVTQAARLEAVFVSSFWTGRVQAEAAPARGLIRHRPYFI